MVRRTRLTDSAQAALWPDWRHHALPPGVWVPGLGSPAHAKRVTKHIYVDFRHDGSVHCHACPIDLGRLSLVSLEKAAHPDRTATMANSTRCRVTTQATG
jgi:hypothetical protein